MTRGTCSSSAAASAARNQERPCLPLHVADIKLANIFYNKSGRPAPDGFPLTIISTNMKPYQRFAICLALLAAAPCVRAEVKPNSLFTDGAVFQQGMALPVWGTANDGEKVTVQFDGDSAETVAKEGKWLVRLKPHKAGGPFTLTITGDNTVTANNVLVGEVWICSGQSNMAFTLGGAANAAEEIPQADNPKLRMFTVPAKPAVSPQTDAQGKWVECSPKTVSGFSAVGYFFGRDIQKATGFPVGMIHTSVGGTPAQAWTSLSGLEADKELQHYVDAIKQVADAYPKAMETYPKDLADFQANLKQWNESDEGKAYNESLKTWTEETKKALAEGKQPAPKPPVPAALPKAPRSPEGGSGTPTVLYNGMVAPLLPYAIKGAIWYQGESNSGNAKEYLTLFPRMMRQTSIPSRRSRSGPVSPWRLARWPMARSSNTRVRFSTR